MVGEVLTGWDRAVGAGHAILPRILALLQTIPADFVKTKCNESLQSELSIYMDTKNE
jgi:hypothetical protein